MAVDATGTRAKLIAAGEQFFATHGIHGAQMRDIVRAAGQANDSAVHYHFGSREGLLRAICERHIDAREPDRQRRIAEQGPAPALATVVHDMLRPTAADLHTLGGRYFLRISAQLAGLAGVRTGSVPPIVGPALRAQLETLRRLCAERMSAELAGERVAVLIGTLTGALADRAVGIDGGRSFALDEETFLANLEAMSVAALQAPVPAVNRS
jgi:TetR/AcrR family transcriptional regulator, regulator of cefoperazone and chloramphenicol sensitivity